MVHLPFGGHFSSNKKEVVLVTCFTCQIHVKRRATQQSYVTTKIKNGKLTLPSLTASKTKLKEPVHQNYNSLLVVSSHADRFICLAFERFDTDASIFLFFIFTYNRAKYSCARDAQIIDEFNSAISVAM